MQGTSKSPGTIGLALRFLRHLPDWWHRHCNLYYTRELGLRHNTLLLDAKTWFYTPDSLIVWKTWNTHLTADYGRVEIATFLKLAEGCQRFLDLGASAGIFSVIFWITRPNAQILAVEPEPNSFKLLEETHHWNSKERSEQWKNANMAIGGEDGNLTLYRGIFGAGITPAAMGTVVPEDGVTKIDIPMKTIASHCQANQFIPDLIKLDIESYEYETLLAAEDFLRQHRPRIHLELHNDIIRERGKEPRDVVRMLARLGYRDQGKALDEEKCQAGICHFELIL